jgi:hypothetical protein
LHPFDEDIHHRTVDLARELLGDEAFAAAWAEGRSMTLEQAVAAALESVGLGRLPMRG